MVDFTPAPEISFTPESAPAPTPAIDFKPAAIDFKAAPTAAKIDFSPAAPAAKPAAKKEEWKSLLPDDPNKNYLSIIPRAIDKKTGKGEWAVPGMLRSAVHAIELPGKVVAGQASPEEMERGALDTALMVAFPMGESTFARPRVAKPVAPEPVAVPGTKGMQAPTPVDVIPTTVQKENPVQATKDAAISIRNIFAPTAAGPNAKLAETAVRDYEGTALRARAMAETSLSKFQAQGSRLAENPEEAAKFYSYVQGRSKGVKLADPELQPFADQLRTMAQETEAVLRELPQTENMNYIQDYFPQMWKDPQRAEAFAASFGTGKQGNKGFTRARKYPTIEDGLKAGLELADANPADAMLSYVSNAQKYASAAKIFNEGREAGVVKWGNANGKIPEGWVPLNGKLASKPGRQIIDAEGNSTFRGEMKAYAPSDYALIYNNFLSTGFEKTAGADAYKAIRGVKNAQTMLQLGLSTHHFATIMAQSMADDLSRVIKNTAAGDMKGAGDALKSFASTPLPIVSKNYRQGNKLRQQYEGVKDFGPDMEERAKLFASAGGRIGEDPAYRGSVEKSLGQSLKEGTLGAEFREGLANAKTNPLGTPVQAVKVAGRFADTVAAPLFKRYIPAMKVGLFDANMQDWIRQNPGASAEEIRVAAKHVMDLMDERYGEIADSNVFWNRTTKQVLGTLLRAPNWDLGLVRQSFGALADGGKLMAQVAKGGGIDKKLLDRPTYLLGYAILGAGFNAAMTKLKTGHWPNDWMDLAAYETGGNTSYNNEERAVFPGHPREIMQMFPKPGEGPLSGLSELSTHKLSSLVSAGSEAVKNQDFKGDPIGGYGDRAFHVLGEPFAPLSLQQMMQGAPRGSALTLPETLMNIRPAPATISDSKQMESFARSRQNKAARTKLKHDAKQKARYPDAVTFD